MSEGFAVGDVVRFHRGEYSHVALYAGRGRVIHLWSPTSARAFCVRIDSLRHVRNCQRRDGGDGDEAGSARDDDDDDDDTENAPQLCTSEMDAKMRRDHGAEPVDGDEAVRRARSRLGETRYDYLSYNCEHFVTWARYGVGASPQATSHTNQVLAGALLGAAVGGIAGLVVGGAISFFSKVNALSASSSGLAVHEADEEIHASEEEEEVEQGQHERRREERERLLDDIAAMQLEDEGSLAEFEAWVAGRQEHRARTTPRTYSEDRHNALAARLAEDKLLCGICFYDLQLTRAVAFPCDHFTCTKCHDALVTSSSGYKCCPYCRTHITNVQSIHRSTKRAARDRLMWEQEIAAAAAAVPST